MCLHRLIQNFSSTWTRFINNTSNSDSTTMTTTQENNGLPLIHHCLVFIYLHFHTSHTFTINLMKAVTSIAETSNFLSFHTFYPKNLVFSKLFKFGIIGKQVQTHDLQSLVYMICSWIFTLVWYWPYFFYIMNASSNSSSLIEPKILLPIFL